VSKLTREDKIKIYERRKKGETIPSLAKNFDVQESNIKYLVDLIEKHEASGKEILDEGWRVVYNQETEKQTVTEATENNENAERTLPTFVKGEKAYRYICKIYICSSLSSNTNMVKLNSMTAIIFIYLLFVFFR